MKTIEELQKLVNSELLKISYPTNPQNLYLPIQYTLEGSGKRLRPLLLLLAHQLYNNDLFHAVKPALGIEMFHNFTLVHDDIMDKSDMRRNKATIHKKWNENIAILSGDAMMILSMRFFLHLPAHIQTKAIDLFTKTALEVCEGQQYDLDFEHLTTVSRDEYLTMIRLKTAVLIACSISMGALIAGASTFDIELLYKAGIEIGLAFQLQDDLLDTFGQQEVFGKNIGNDIVNRKKTYLYILAYELANNEQKKQLDYWFNHTNISNETRIQEVKKIYSELNIEQHTNQQIEFYIHNSLNKIDSLNTPNSPKDLLKEFIHQLIARKK